MTVAGFADVLTYHNDNSRTGVNPFDTALTVIAHVSSGFSSTLYATAKAHFACKVCYTDALCANEPTCANHACCQDQILHWYRYPNAPLVYAGHTLNVAEEILLKSDDNK